jgi:hypothetical protein
MILLVAEVSEIPALHCSTIGQDLAQQVGDVWAAKRRLLVDTVSGHYCLHFAPTST